MALVVVSSASAQDLLVKRNGEQMRVKVLKITKKNVEYVRHGTELPVYKLPVTEISYIEYPMGDRDIFDKSLAEAKSQVTRTPSTPPAKTTDNDKIEGLWHGPVPPPQGGQIKVEVTPPDAHRYSVGEIYNKDGIIGIVTMLYDGGLHGLVMSLDEACLAWSTLPRKQTKNTGANNRNDGKANMKAIEKYIADKNLSWDSFPAFKWCRDKGEGWYLPSINELWSVGTMSMGGSRVALNRKFRKNYNNAIEAAGGTPLSNIMIYHSSTEDRDIRYSYYGHMNSESPNIDSGYKADKLFVRAVYKF